MRLSFVICVLLLSINSINAASRPNVILIMSDDQGYGELSCHGNPILKTPHLDQLAAESIRLTDFHVAPMCTPTRGQLMSGLDAFRNGAMNVSSGRTLLRPELKTMADLFQAAGYRTGIFGKWHLGDNYPFRPEDRGFQETLWFPSSHIGAVPDFWNNDYFEDTYTHNGNREKFQGYCTDVFFREMTRWVCSQDSSQPCFAYLPLNAPHGPHFVPDQFRRPIEQAIEKNESLVAHLSAAKRKSLVSYLAMCANIDQNIGKLDQELRNSRLLDNTIVVFLTDNGSTMGPDYFNAGMRGKKVTLWEGGHRVPCFIRWPAGKLGAPRALNDLTHVQDLLPTLTELCDVPQSLPRLDGISLVPRLRGAVKSLPDRMLVIDYSRMPFPGNKKSMYLSQPRKEGSAVLWKRWRWLENRELYDLTTDPLQQKNVVAEYPEVVKKMQAHLDQWWSELEPTVAVPQRVIVGHPSENPAMLTACEWLDVFVDQQRQVRRGVRRNGTWHLIVDRPGNYQFELRRWPRESGLQLTEGTPALKVTDGLLVQGVALPVTKAKIKIGTFTATANSDSKAESITFTTSLEKGPVELTTWLLDGQGKEICGAYYVYVNRQSD
ncbi:arylsulfatase [Gimesia maris]|uniref:Arylsulfatase n=1 Tax=Gimesia maris TaxID=122 RepID=A0ABX5YJL4_9PLAN|nr:arylsulfatase [Gimesia maris]EDL61245.1 arylsulfatase [Gimesia maris DSM 8797]QEG15901.1 Arylsulfatase [Gimesia maris]QGQ30836.1 arylsulfatase [Gimesia maris]